MYILEDENTGSIKAENDAGDVEEEEGDGQVCMEGLSGEEDLGDVELKRELEESLGLQEEAGLSLVESQIAASPQRCTSSFAASPRTPCQRTGASLDGATPSRSQPEVGPDQAVPAMAVLGASSADDDDFHVGFRNVEVEAVDQGAAPDETLGYLDKARGFTTVKEFRKALLPAGLATGLHTYDEVYETTIKFLEKFNDETNTHRQIATDIHFDGRLTAPVPHALWCPKP